VDSAETILFGGMPMGAYEADRDVEGERRTAVKALMIRPREKPRDGLGEQLFSQRPGGQSHLQLTAERSRQGVSGRDHDLASGERYGRCPKVRVFVAGEG